MASPAKQSTHSLQLERVVTASPQQVYEAWTNPKILSKWFAPANDFQAIVHAIDVKVGGSYRIEMRSPDGAPHTAIGEYRELLPGKKLVFSWRWAESADMKDTLVTVELTPQGRQTQVVLTHTLFQTAKASEDHSKGWTGCLSRLAELW